MPSNNIIIFDLWQTLADSALKPSDLFDRLFPFDRAITKQDFLEVLFYSDLYMKDVLLEEGIKRFLSDLGISNKEKLSETIFFWKEMIQRSFLINGAENLLPSLKDRGYKLCLLTNVDKYGYENFPYKDFLNLFDYQFLSYSKGLRKPNIKCWKIIKDYYQTSYKNMIMIGDSIKDDILPSKNIGLSTILINTDDNNRYNEVYRNLIN